MLPQPGTYLLINLQTGTALSLAGYAIAEQPGSNREQQWLVSVDEKTGLYTLKNVLYNMYASASQLYPKYKGYAAVQGNTLPSSWSLKPGTTDAAYYVYSMDPAFQNYLMDLYGGGTSNGTYVILNPVNPTPSNSLNQQWQFAKIDLPTQS